MVSLTKTVTLMVRVNKLELQTTTRGIKDFTSTFGGGGRHFANAYQEKQWKNNLKKIVWFGGYAQVNGIKYSSRNRWKITAW